MTRNLMTRNRSSLNRANLFSDCTQSMLGHENYQPNNLFLNGGGRFIENASSFVSAISIRDVDELG